MLHALYLNISIVLGLTSSFMWQRYISDKMLILNIFNTKNLEVSFVPQMVDIS